MRENYIACPTLHSFRFPLLLVLIAAGLAGNYYSFSIFLDIDFLFGSIFALLALQFFGLGRGIVAAALIASSTYILLNHPYAIIILTAEVAVVGWLMGRYKWGMVLADTLYWLLIGMPLVYLFYHFVMHAPFSNTSIIMTKQALNGIVNALAARLIFTAFALRLRPPLISYSEIIYNLLTFFVLCPALIMLAVDSRDDFAATDLSIRTSLIQDSGHLAQRLETWVLNRKTAIINLAEMAASRTPQQMQTYLEQTKKSDLNFQRVGLTDKEATTVAIFPLVDEQGKTSLGINFADRPHIPQLQRTLKPMLSEVVIGKIGIPMPMVLMLAPVVIRGEYSGYVFGRLSMEQLQRYLDKSSNQNATLYALLDKNGNVIMTNRTDQKIMKPFARDQGTLDSLEAGIYRWMPTTPPNTPRTERWRKSSYIAESSIGDLTEWKLILEQPVAPYQKALYDHFTDKLTLLFLILLGALTLAELLSRKTVAALGQLSTLTHELPGELTRDSSNIAWPKSGFKEAHQLINNFREMADLLAEKFHEIRQVNESLEQRVKERTEELRKSEEGYRTIADFTYDWEYWLDPHGSLRYIAPSCERHTGYPAEEFRQKPDLLNSIVHPDDRDELASHLPVQRDAVMHGEQHHTNFRITNRNGEERWFAHVCQAVYTDNGEYLGQRASNRDITENIRASEELLKAKAAAEAANIAKSQFLANMSHEIRTPMNGVLGLIELLLGTELTEKQREYAELVKLSGKNLMQLISDILDLSKIEAHKIELETRDFDLQAETTGLINLFALNAQGKGLELNAQIDADVPLHLQGDAGRLRQILTNLIGNAIKFTEKGSVSLHIRKDAENDARTTLRFLVRDSGIGIAADKLEQIFAPFTQADNSTTRKYGGTGLGLTISRQLAELMGGTVGVESVETQGTTFWFTAVLGTRTERRRTPRSSLASGQQVESSLQKTATDNNSSILLVEDDLTNQLVTKDILEKFGYKVDVASNGSKAIKALEMNDYALVLMDCMMPVLNGFEATAVIRNHASAVRNHAIPVIALTANAFNEDRATCLAVGMNDYLAKPIEILDLLAMLEKWVPCESTEGRDARNMDVTAAPPSASHAIFDRDEFVNRSLGDLELSRHVASIFIDNGPEYIEAIRNALIAKDAEKLRLGAHKLKGAAATIALPQLSETAGLIETFAETGNLEKAQVLFPELMQRFEQALKALREDLS